LSRSLRQAEITAHHIFTPDDQLAIGGNFHVGVRHHHANGQQRVVVIENFIGDFNHRGGDSRFRWAVGVKDFGLRETAA
jgi:hypothetical protein